MVHRLRRVETLLGVKLEGTQLRVTPRFPAGWPGYKIRYRYRQTVYHIAVTRAEEEAMDAPELALDGQPLSDGAIPLTDDRNEHFVELRAARVSGSQSG